jgi:hypothetical protein
MIGNGYWATGITLKWSLGIGWSAAVEFYDDGLAEQDSTEGVLRTRYFENGENALARQIDCIEADAERLGITFGGPGDLAPTLYYHGDGQDPQWLPPEVGGSRWRLSAAVWAGLSQPALSLRTASDRPNAAA